MIAATGDSLPASFGVLVGLLVLVLAVAWAIFPFIVISKFNELLKVQRETLKEVRDLATQLARNAANPSATEFDKVKALQWMVDNWPNGPR
jgi:hypothetical protein